MDLNIWCIGSNIESYECLKRFEEEGLYISGLITLPTNSHYLASDYYDLESWWKLRGRDIIITTDVNSDDTILKIRKAKVDVLLTLGWSQIFKKQLLAEIDLVIGSHPTKLPIGKGRAPLPWTLLNGLNHSAVSFFIIDEGIDSGPLILQKEFKFDSNIYVGELYKLVSSYLATGFVEILNKILKKEPLTTLDQDTGKETFYAKRRPDDGLLNFNQDSKAVQRIVRSLSHPYPGAYTFYKGELLKVFKATHVDIGVFSALNGQIVKKVTEGLVVQCADGQIMLADFRNKYGVSLDVEHFQLHSKFGMILEKEVVNLYEILKRNNIQ